MLSFNIFGVKAFPACFKGYINVYPVNFLCLQGKFEGQKSYLK